MRYRLLLFVFLLSGIYTGLEAQWLNGWTHRKLITLDNTQVSGGVDLIDFPVLIDITENSLRTIPGLGIVESSGGDDFRFTSSDMTTLLDFEIEKYDEVNGQLIAWVKIPLLDFNDDTKIYLYFGNSIAAAYPNPENTWSNNYTGVWHLHDDFIDATVNNNDAINNGSSDQSGFIADGQDFDGTGQYLEIDQSVINDGNFTISLWYKYDFYSGTLFDATNSLEGNGKYFYSGFNSGVARWYFESDNDNDAQVSSAFNSGTTWHYLTVIGRYNNNFHELFIDGNSLSTSSTILDGKANLYNLRFGYTYGHAMNPFAHFDGLEDEIRVSNIDRSSDWIQTEYNNQNAPSSFYSVGALEVPNDIPCNAAGLPITECYTPLIYSTIGATNSGIANPGCANYSGGDVWFKVTIPASGKLIIETDTEANLQYPNNNGWMYHMGMALYSGACGSLSLISCIEDNSYLHSRMARIELSGETPGTIYHIRVWENSNNDNGKFNISAFNDDVNPVITCLANQSQSNNFGDCSAVVNGLSLVSKTDNCTSDADLIVSYTLLGATTGNGNNDASGSVFNVGTTTVN